MKIYFAGVPAGLQRTREEELEEKGISHRLVTYFYTKKCMITLKHYAKADINYTKVRDYG